MKNQTITSIEYRKRYIKKRRIQHEAKLQMQFVKKFRELYPGKIIFHIPNGGKRNILEAIRLKEMGVLPGIPDLCIPEPMNGKHGMYLEAKDANGKLTNNQEVMISLLLERGYVCCQFNCVEAGINAVKAYFDSRLSVFD